MKSPPRTRAMLGLVALSLPTLLVAMDISVLNVALPTMGRELHAGPTELLWIIDIYNFTVAGAMLTTGAIADRIGRRRMLLTCASVFAVASGAGAFATTPELVILARGVMGLVGSAIMPIAMALLGTLFADERSRIRAMGAMMTVFLLGMAVAPLVGGVLLDHFWWGSVFLAGVPVMAITVVVVPRLVAESKATVPAPLDLPSAALSIVALLSLVFGLKRAVNSGLDAPAMAVFLVGVVGGSVLVQRQKRLEHPLLDRKLIARPRVWPALLVLLFTALLMGGTSLFFNLYLQQVQGLSPLQAAWWSVPQMVSMIAAANLGPWLKGRLPDRTLTVGTMLVMAAGFVVYLLAPVNAAGRPIVAVGACLATLGIGAAFPMLMDSVISAAPPERAASSASLAQLCNELGIALGLTVLGSLGTVVYRARLARPDSVAERSVIDGVTAGAHDPALLSAVRHAYTDAFHVAALVAVAVMVVVVALVSRTTGAVSSSSPTDSAPEPRSIPRPSVSR
jgi:MFS transporter, DHA2 family, multidrug resistance protein